MIVSYIMKNVISIKCKAGFLRFRSFAAAAIAAFFIIFLLSLYISLQCLAAPHSLKDYDGSRLAAAALSQIGSDSGEKYWRWCGFDQRVDWCACFVSWCAGQCYDNAPVYASCAEFKQWFRERGRLYDRDITPAAGMVVFFDNDGNSHPDHIGILSSCRDGVISVVEGNSSDMCVENFYELTESAIMAYGAF